MRHDRTELYCLKLLYLVGVATTALDGMSALSATCRAQEETLSLPLIKIFLFAQAGSAGSSCLCLSIGICFCPTQQIVATVGEECVCNLNTENVTYCQGTSGTYNKIVCGQFCFLQE